MSAAARSLPLLRLRGRTSVVHRMAHWQWHPRERAHHNLWVCLQGTGTMEIAGRAYNVQPGFAVIIAPRTAVRGGCPAGGGMHNIGVHFHLPRLAAASFRPATERGVELRHLPLMRELAFYLQALLLEPAGIRAEAEAVARQMLRIFLRELGAPAEDTVTRHIRRQAADIEIEPGGDRNVESLAREAGLSTSQYTRRFRELFGTTPAQFIIALRINHARRLLRETNLGLDEIARQLGYHDQAFFSRQFRAKTGIAPRRHRHPPSGRQL